MNWKSFYKTGVIFFFAGLLTFLTSCDSVNAYFDSKKSTLNKNTVAFYIPSSTTIEELKSLLIDNHLILPEEIKDFQTLLTYKSFTEERIGAGKYIIEPHTHFNTLINGFTKNRLGNGNQEVEVRVTFNNCRDIYAIAAETSREIEMDSSAFIHYILSDSILAKYGFNEATICALFLPNTYRFFWDTDAQEFVERMAGIFKEFWNAERYKKLHEIGLKEPSDAVTLASIVYKEQSRRPEEWKTIAGLYLNRLKRGMKLQSDPTFRFCWGDKLQGVERLTYKHRAIDCPYNTYIYPGLPPGPIYVPPTKAVEAVLNASHNAYLFMCAQPNGTGLHNFARTLREHNINANKYQNWLSNRE